MNKASCHTRTLPWYLVLRSPSAKKVTSYVSGEAAGNIFVIPSLDADCINANRYYFQIVLSNSQPLLLHIAYCLLFSRFFNALFHPVICNIRCMWRSDLCPAVAQCALSLFAPVPIDVHVFTMALVLRCAGFILRCSLGWKTSASLSLFFNKESHTWLHSLCPVPSRKQSFSIVKIDGM